MGALPPNPWDFSHGGQNDPRRRWAPPPAIPAAESALGLRPRSALSSAQVLPEWITSTSPCNDLSSNGDNPLNFVSHSRGSLQFVQLTLYSFPSIWEEQRDEVGIYIESTTDCEEAQVSKYCDFMEDGEISEDEKSAISQLIALALQWNDPVGFHLEYNDGPSNRASGYYRSANTVAYSISRPSFHELAEARHALIGILAEHGLAEKGEELLPKGERESG